jgi:hypothetical protein
MSDDDIDRVNECGEETDPEPDMDMDAETA